MLGSLAKWLRILGSDTFYPDNTMTDEQIIQLAKREQRLLISRDKTLIAQAKKEHVSALGLQTTNLDEQLHLVLTSLHLDIHHVLTRCTLCNTILEPVDKSMVRDHIPPRVFDSRDAFWYCTACQKYYWMGTHYDNMVQKIHLLMKNNSR